ncbi:riboflavin synthase [Tepidibacillus fermentans]|uniref:Riboflavin synthase n=1 Tax=Tepidibacillus fermentans TaxID=1281767 RepID=A0A4R3KCV0_9BACI|nr:riboflavin synthase [Tepidibacillus fermentans]TCS81066.1 riboflavin synthase alpha chain [Tepidibacillus fermentans]
MFTGLVEEVGIIKAMKRSGDSMVLTIEARQILEDVSVGDSIAVNGICLTVTSYQATSFTVDVMPETIYKTNLRELKVHSFVNLERAMTPSRRFGGHFVAGHVDGIATLIEKKTIDNAVYFTFETESSLLKYMIPKGSIAIDGISLTLVDVSSRSFTVSIIPHTFQQTNLSTKQIGQSVNIEVDMIGKFVEKYVMNFLNYRDQVKQKITESFLKENGFL